MRRHIVLFCLAICATACDKEAKEIVYDPPEKGPQLPVPTFQIRVTLSDSAAKKLRDAHETIKVAVWFDGDGDSRPGEYTAPMRPVVLSRGYDFELDQPGVVSVDHATVSQEAFNRLTDKDYYYTINVYSGRHAFENNILGGGFADGHISEATKKPIEIKCDLLPSH